MPVATLTNIRWSTSGYARNRSPSAITLTSLSTTTSAPRSDSPTKPRTSKPSQPGMIGGLVGRPVANSTGPGRPMPTPTTSAIRRPAAAHEGAAPIDDPRQDLVRADRDVEVDDVVGEHGCGEVGDGEAHVGGTDVGTEHEPRPRVEGEPCRRASTGRRRLTSGGHQRAGDEGVDALGDRRATEAGGSRQLTTGAWCPVTEQLQQAPALPARPPACWLPTEVLNHIHFPSHQGVFCLTTGRSRLGSKRAGGPRGRTVGIVLLSNQGPARRHLA